MRKEGTEGESWGGKLWLIRMSGFPLDRRKRTREGKLKINRSLKEKRKLTFETKNKRV